MTKAYEVTYPNLRRTFTVEGEWKLFSDAIGTNGESLGTIATITTGSDEVFILDPRCTAVTYEGSRRVVVYQPRAPGVTHTPRMAAWLAEHPEWPYEYLR